MLSSIRPRRSNASKPASTRSKNIATKVESAAHAQLLAQKRARVPLAVKADVNGVAPGPSKLSLPRTLPRPVLREIDLCNLVNGYPDLAGIPAQYIRDHLPATATMQAAVHAVETSIPKSALPKELEILMNDIVAAACPTHMFAVYSNTPLAINQKRRVSLFPIHDIVFGVHCANLPALSFSHSATVSTHKTIPVVPLCIPSPETFPLLHSYLYTRQPETLLSALDRPCETDFLQLASHAMKIHGLWRNACSLGVVDEKLYELIEDAWETTLAAMQAASSS
ncbi:hypothetical protein C8J57DRAFT_1244343 [Mycena rebaudengoi]|nr:hypothetical protein C8J57DRAFT_1244343 [Mycena rebaudengoi]